MNHYFGQYEAQLEHVLGFGSEKTDRTGTGTRSLFGLQMRWHLSQGFPLVTTKRVHTRSMVEELLWFLSGSTDNNVLVEKNVHIWDAWAKEDGSLGPIYGKQWRSWPRVTRSSKGTHFGHIDQIARLMIDLQLNPDSRRHVISAWNVNDLPDMALAPCHCLFQFYVQPMTLKERYRIFVKRSIGLEASSLNIAPLDDGTKAHQFLDLAGISRSKLSCQLYQRSADMFLGVPFNIASYALLTHMVAQQVGMEVGEFIWTGGDCHIYDNHLDQVKEQLSRKGTLYPELKLNKAASIFDYKLDDVEFIGYNPLPAIKAPVAV